MMQVRWWVRFALLLLRSLPMFVRVSWRRHNGILPERVGLMDHDYSIRIKGPNGENNMTLSGRCSREEAPKLMGFLAVYEIPIVGIAVRDNALLEIHGGNVTGGRS